MRGREPRNTHWLPYTVVKQAGYPRSLSLSLALGATTRLCLLTVLEKPVSKGPRPSSANLCFSLVAATGRSDIRRSWLEAQWLPGVGEAQLAGQVWGGPKQLQGVWKAFERLMSAGSN